MQPLFEKRHWIAIIAITGLCIATLCAARVWFATARYSALETLPMPQPVVDFQLYGSGSTLLTQKQLRGHWSLVFFGFSHCVDVCPMELEIMARVLKDVQTDRPDAPKINGLFISLDPERDSQAVIDGYLSAFGSSIAGARGNHSELVRLVRFFGADYNRSVEQDGAAINVPAGYAVPLGNQQDYQVNHSPRFYLINPGGQYIGSFPPPHNAKYIADDLQMILKR